MFELFISSVAIYAAHLHWGWYFVPAALLALRIWVRSSMLGRIDDKLDDIQTGLQLLGLNSDGARADIKELQHAVQDLKCDLKTELMQQAKYSTMPEVKQ